MKPGQNGFSFQKWPPSTFWLMGLSGVALCISYMLALGLFKAPPAYRHTPYAKVLFDRNGKLLDAEIAADEQWRFPMPDSVPFRFEMALKTYEDQRFDHHFGVDIWAVLRALGQNIKAGKVVSGASTLSMQLGRMQHQSEARTLGAKFTELLKALHFEMAYTKTDLLRLYALHAPFGGNVVGLEAAAYRYFAQSAHQLSWAQAATLAVLPNAPSMIYPGKNQDRLKEKRDFLLQQLHQNGHFDALTLDLSLAESLPERVYPLPMKAPHALRFLLKNQRKAKLKSTLIHDHQMAAHTTLQQHAAANKAIEVHHAAALVLDVNSGAVLAYVGNVGLSEDRKIFNHDAFVDVVQAKRSTGSILKPFLFMDLLANTALMPTQLLPDIPLYHQGFSPVNFDRKFEGAVAADAALTRSRNVPFVHLLQQHDQRHFLGFLQKMNLTGINKGADHYGLSLILGGAEASLWELTAAYGNLANLVKNYHSQDYQYLQKPFQAPIMEWGKERDTQMQQKPPVIDAGSVAATLAMLKSVNRPERWRNTGVFDKKSVAWKTGTSYGHRDAWAIGVNQNYAVGVWVGNADGSGRAGLTGTEKAAPILFDIFEKLPNQTPLFTQVDDFKKVLVCQKSGFPLGRHCPESKSIDIPFAKQELPPPCSYHIQLMLDEEQAAQVHQACYPPERMTAKVYFQLPPAMDWFYRKHIGLGSLPDWKSGCEMEEQQHISFIYPPSGITLIAPKGRRGVEEALVLEVAHQKPGRKVFWYLNNEYLGMTKSIHQMPLKAPAGAYTLRVVDENGESIARKIQVGVNEWKNQSES